MSTRKSTSVGAAAAKTTTVATTTTTSTPTTSTTTASTTTASTTTASTTIGTITTTAGGTTTATTVGATTLTTSATATATTTTNTSLTTATATTTSTSIITSPTVATTSTSSSATVVAETNCEDATGASTTTTTTTATATTEGTVETPTIATTTTSITPSSTTTTKATAAPVPDETSAMGTNASSLPPPESSSSSSDTETKPTVKESSTKESAKVPEATKTEVKRITRNSPLPLTTGGIERKASSVDREHTNSESEEGATTTTTTTTIGGKRGQIRGRKSLKEAKEVKEQLKESDKGDDKEKDKEKEKEESEARDSKDLKDNKSAEETKDSATKATAKGESLLLSSATASSATTPTTTASSSNSTSSSTATPTSTTTTTTPTPTPVSNRLTRKSAAQDLVVSTRVTRNRQSATASAAASRPETPPTTISGRGRRGAARKMPVPMETAAKRKRSEEDGTSAAGTAEPGAKYIKIEVKDKDKDDGTDASETTDAGGEASTDVEGVKIKQELIESDDTSRDAVASTASTTTATATTTTTSGRGRGRWGPRKPPPVGAVQNSPTTRATRQTKAISPSPSASAAAAHSEAKRRRTTTTVTRSSSTSLLKSSQHQPPPDEDSKDSLASSMDDSVAAGDLVKLEKLTPEIEIEDEDMDDVEEKEQRRKAQLSTPSGSETEKSSVLTDATATPPKAANGVAEPLTVDTEIAASSVPAAGVCVATPAVSTPTVASASGASSDKAASLSPEMVSEGVCEISVKQFYKKPEFLENNRGIEEDPKLGEIVQKVSTEKSAASTLKDSETAADTLDDALSDSNESLKEGDLRLDESTDEKKSSTIDDNGSLSSEHLSPLVVEDDDGDDVLVLNDALHEDEEVELDEDDATVEESETISMDNNPSTDDAHDQQEMEADLEEAEVEGDETAPIVEEKEETKALVKAKDLLSSDPMEVDTKESLVKEELKPDIKAKLDVESQQVIAKIDAELKAIGAKQREHKDSDEIVEAKKEAKAEVDKMDKDAAEQTIEIPDVEEADHDVVAESSKAPTKEGESAKPSPTSSTTASPAKQQQAAAKEDDTHSTKSGQSTDTNSWVTLDLEYDEEALRQKEQHLQNLGLLTHKAAEMRRQEFIQSSAAAVEASRTTAQHSSKRNGKAGAGHAEYTGTLKTVIKLNRSAAGGAGNGGSAAGGAATSSSNGGRKSNGGGAKDGNNSRRQSLKMTFQKGRGRGQAGSSADRAAESHAHSEDSYYTIQNENEGASRSTPATELSHYYSHGRKSYNRSNTSSSATTTTNSATIDSSHSEGQDGNAAMLSKKDEKEEILIPEKASSFKFHPGRLCQDQCFYCSGKFGLYDTPCHVGQIKSIERQQKILANEEKLTVDNCLCDACFRHVDRRANVPSYKKRLSAPGHLETALAGNSSDANALDDGQAEEEPQARKCLVSDCPNPAAHSLRRKCIRKSVKKFLLNFDMPTGGSYVSLCQAHYDAVIQCSGCVLCKRRLGKNHMYHITSDTDRLEKALSEMGIPVQLGIGTAVCKLCRYFANLLMKPPDRSKSQKAEFVKNYRKRLLQFHNIHDGSHDPSEADEDESNSAKTPQKKGKSSGNAEDDSTSTTPAKELTSPAGSTGSSVECVGEANTSASGVNDLSRTSDCNNQMLLDNDVLVDYDVPMISSESNSCSPSPPSGPAQMSKLKAILQNPSASYDDRADISTVLRSNPNISMRELFPGEEDLGLQFKAPFGSSTSQRTPEGWTRVQTFLQYDEPTRRLWEELQKPYGNQSSFLRHLILLEKYFRNGDLVLTPHASSNASVYTQTVRQRLTSYDQGHCGGLDSAKSSTAAAASASASASASKEKDDTPVVDEDDDDDVVAVESNNEDEEDLNSGKQLRSRRVSVDKLTKQLNTNAVTIIARSKDGKETASPQKSLLISQSKDREASLPSAAPNLAAAAAAAAAALTSSGSNSNSSTTSSNSRSILKTNLLGINKSVEILPISSASKTATAASANAAAGGETKQQKILDVANKLLGNQLEAVASTNSSGGSGSGGSKAGAVSLLTSPPELVSLQRRASTSGTGGTNTTPTAAVVVSGAVNAAVGGTAAASTSSSGGGGGGGGGGAGTSLINAKRAHLLPKGGGNRPTAPPNVVILPDTLTPQERLQSKSWRPTLMPVEENQHLANKGGPLYQTADGRRLPALVQVQSGGKPFLISIFDYNRMCILRREKLLRDQMLKATKNRREMQQQHHQQRSANAAAAAAAQSNLQNAFANNMAANKQQQQAAQHQAAQQQLMQLQFMQMQKNQQKQQQQQQQQHQQQQAAALKSIARFQPIAPKPTAASSGATTSTASSSAVAAATSGSTTNFSAPMMPLLASAITSANVAAGANSAAAVAAAANASWLWNNFPDANQLLMNGAAGAPLGGKLPQLLAKPPGANFSGVGSKPQHLLLDNTLMSKIPKSLTVIPQHKLMGGNAAGAGNSSGSNKE